MRQRWGVVWLLCLVGTLGGCSVPSTTTEAPIATAVQPVVGSPTYAVAVQTCASTATSGTRVIGKVSGTATFVPLGLPYPPPPSCTVASWNGHERRHNFPAFWLDNGGLAAGNPIGTVLFAGGQKIQWQAAVAESRELAVTGTRLDGAVTADAGRPVPLVDRPSPLDAGVWSTSTAFPEGGCWRLQATSGTHTFDAIVYVYPDACRPPALRLPGATPGTCRPPG